MLRGSPAPTLVTVTVALFTDGFLYGVLVPLGAGGETMVGIMYGVYAFGVLASTPIFGVLSDRVGRRRPMLWGFAAQALATVLFALQGGVGLTLLARLLQGVAAAATWTTGLALVAEHFTERRAEKLGVAMMGSTGGLLVGPVTGGVLLQMGGHALPLLVAGAALVVDGALRVTILTDRAEAPLTAPSRLISLLRDRSVQAAAVVVVLSSIGWSLLEPLFPNHLERVLGASPATVGLLFTVSSLAYGLSAPLVGKVVDRFGPWPTMTFGIVAMAATLPLLVVPRTIVMAGVVLVLVDVAFGFLMNPTLDELANAVDRGHAGAYASVYAIFNMAYSIGTIGTTFMETALGSLASFGLLLVGVSAALLLCLPLLRVLRRSVGGDAPGKARVRAAH